MKTKVRILKSNVEYLYDSSNHQRLIFQVLDNKYNNTDYLEPILEICFFAFSTQSEKIWSYSGIKCDSQNPDHFAKAAKIAKLIKEKMYWNFSIPEFMNLLNCEEYQYTNGYFLPVKWDQISEYHLLIEDKVYKSFFAYNELSAQNKADDFMNENYRNSVIPDYSVKLVQSNISIKATDLTINL